MKQKQLINPFIFLLAPVLATALGMITVRSMEIPISVYYPNVLGIIIGFPLFYYLAPLWSDRKINLVYGLSVLAIVLFMAGFLFPGPRDVHRWLTIGNFNVNIAMVVLPVVLYCLHQLLHEQRIPHGIFLYACIGVILGFQPDAGEATAFGLAGLVVFFRNKVNLSAKLFSVVVAGIMIFLAWNRVDLLESVEYVEEALYLIASLGPLGILGMTVVSILIFVPFIYMSFKRVETVRTLSIAFIVYLSASFIVTEFGHFPVPVLGAGASSVIGWFLMLSFVYRPH